MFEYAIYSVMESDQNKMYRFSGNRTPITKLSQSVADRIAAGEVVQGPSAVVKELLENAIDASATNIEVAISDGGKSLIKVKDNGWGIPKNELTLAI